MTQDEFMAIAVEAIDKHFPKGETPMRGEAMVLIADILRGLIDKGLVSKK